MEAKIPFCKRLVWIILLLQGNVLCAQTVSPCDSLISFSIENFHGLMNSLFGLSEGKLHHCFFSDYIKNNDITEISSIQKMLNPVDVMLEYCLTDTSMTLFIISKSVFSIYQQDVSPEFWKTIADFRRKIRLADIRGLAALSHKLYLSLVAPAKEILRGKRHLIVIPGRDLLGIPFEALIVDENRCGKTPHFNNYHYLIQDYEIAYHFSARLWRETGSRKTGRMDQEPRFKGIDFAGFSPGSYQNLSITPLPYARNELFSIAVLFKQKGLNACLEFAQNSKEGVFKEVAGKSRIIHLATHSHFNHYNPELKGILFWDYEPDADPRATDDGLLSFREAESLHLKADLIVLNSCASGTFYRQGYAAAGSFPLGFIKAGAKNILSTLWNVTDRLAKDIVLGFYRKWLSGKTFSEALREVKLELIQSRETALPTIWASYILIGQ